ncbi:MAG: PAS domain S-box protein [Polyangiaceae bacterium]
MIEDSSTTGHARSQEELERDLAVALSANQALRESDAAHRLLFDGSPLPLLVFDVDTLGILAANEAALRLFGYARDEMMRTRMSDLARDDHEAIRARTALMGDGEAFRTRRYYRKDGSPVVVEFTSRALKFEGRRARITVIKDITERHEAERARALLAAIVQCSNDAVMSLGLDGTVTSWNAAAQRLFGYSAEEALGRPLAILVPQDRLEETRVLQHRVLAGERIEAYETSRRRKDGSDVAVSVSLAPLLDSAGNVVGLSGTARDLTSQRNAEKTQALLAAIVQSSNDAIVSKTLDGTITSWNDAAERLFGYTAEETLGRSITVLIPPDRLDEERVLIGRVAAGDRVDHYETIRLRRDGTEVALSISLAPVLDASGRVIGASKTARDLTEQRKAEKALRRTEDQLRQAQKMEAVGRLAGGVAHDFNNVLSVILSYGEMIHSDLRQDDPMRGDVEEITRAAQRAAGLTRQLLLFSRQQVVEPKVLDLNEILGGMDKMLKRIVGEDVDLTWVPTPDLGRIRADAGNVEQVIMNLVVNARDAMPTGGQLTIEARNVDLDDDYAREHIGSAPGHHVMLAVSDNGVGMDKATQSRIFEPFFTTKEPGKGTGLGLSTVFGIAQQSGGSIWVYSEPGKGTTFKVYFPRVIAEVDAPHQTLPPVTLRGQETILLVEDEEQVRAVAQSILKRNGYRVIVAQNAGEALIFCEKHPGIIHMLLTDVVMPQMSGAELAKRIAKTRPDMRVLCMSGYTDDSIVRHGVLESGVAFMQKPFTPETLMRKVREVFNTPRGER